MKLILKCAVAAALVFGNVGASASLAKPGAQESITFFYDDEFHSNVVGGVVRYCDGTRYRWGSYSLYLEEYYYGCP